MCATVLSPATWVVAIVKRPGAVDRCRAKHLGRPRGACSTGMLSPVMADSSRPLAPGERSTPSRGSSLARTHENRACRSRNVVGHGTTCSLARPAARWPSAGRAPAAPRPPAAPARRSTLRARGTASTGTPRPRPRSSRPMPIAPAMAMVMSRCMSGLKAPRGTRSARGRTCARCPREYGNQGVGRGRGGRRTRPPAGRPRAPPRRTAPVASSSSVRSWRSRSPVQGVARMPVRATASWIALALRAADDGHALARDVEARVRPRPPCRAEFPPQQRRFRGRSPCRVRKKRWRMRAS